MIVGPSLAGPEIDEGAYEQTELASLKNLVSLLFQLEKTPVKEIGVELFSRLLEWLGDNRELQRAFVVFMNRVYFRERVDVDQLYREATTREVRAMLERNVERWIDEWKAEGRAEGRLDGRMEGRAEERIRLARRMLASGMSVAQVAELTELSEEEVLNLREKKSNRIVS